MKSDKIPAGLPAPNMSRFHSHINTAREIISAFSGDGPFSLFIKQFFARHKKFGSKDRKNISHLAFLYFRLASLMPEAEVEDIIKTGIFLSVREPQQEFPEEWNQRTGYSLSDKLNFLGFGSVDVFPFNDFLSPEIDREQFGLSLLVQPSLFVRLRPGQEDIVIQEMSDSGIVFSRAGKHALELAPGTDLRELDSEGKKMAVQDLSSQQVMDDLSEMFRDKPEWDAWDCCAGSGGKSILLWDLMQGKVSITATDIRESILNNLKKRLSGAGVSLKECRMADVSAGQMPEKKFPLIICDVPCSGSGTWARTPEQMFFFKTSRLDDFVKRQKAIVSQASSKLLPGGYFLYITCSVFSLENEGLKEYIRKELNLRELKSHYIKGYDRKADTMYVSLFQSPLIP